MKFADTELLPGVVVNDEDPKQIGRVKVNCPGLFNSGTMKEEGLPWVYPITMWGYQNFSKIKKGSKVWIFKQKNNYKEFWYMPMFELNGLSKQLLGNYSETEILFARQSGETSAYINYTEDNGMIIAVSDSTITLLPDSQIIIKAGDANVKLAQGKVYIGSESSGEPAVLGNKLVDALTSIKNSFDQLMNASTPFFTAHLKPVFKAAGIDLQAKINEVLCKNTFVD